MDSVLKVSKELHLVLAKKDHDLPCNDECSIVSKLRKIEDLTHYGYP